MKEGHEIILDGVIEKPAMKLVGKKLDCILDEKYNYQNITELWRSFNAELSGINERLNKDKWQKFGLYYGSTGKSFHYASCVPVGSFNQSHDGLIQKVIPALTYLQFRHVGSIRFLFSSVKAIYTEYLIPQGIKPLKNQSIGFNHFEEYGKDFNWTHPTSELKILVPVDLSELPQTIQKVKNNNLSLF